MDAEFWEKENPRFLEKDASAHDRNSTLYPAVPEELKRLRQWLLWRYEVPKGKEKPTKVPYQTSGYKAKSNNSKTWTDFTSVCKNRKGYSGIGFVFSDTDPYCGVDLDECLSNGEKKAWAKPIVEKLKEVSYGEISPSRTGIKFWTRAKLPENIQHKVYIFDDADDAIEAYDSGRYFTVTGRGKGEIRDGQSVVDWLISEYLKQKPIQPQKARPSPQLQEGTDEIIAKIRKSKQCHKFDALMVGNTTGYGSQSEADMALCSIIAFWTQNSQQIDTIFCQSALYREKWDEKHRSDGATYGEMTIEAVLSGNRTTYTPPKQKKRKRRVNFYEARAKRRRYGN